jgi:hypothetical protein
MPHGDDDGSASTSFEYLVRCRTARNRDPPRPVEHALTCEAEDSLWSALCLALTHDVHHVYVVYQDGATPRAVVSFSDLWRWIFRRRRPFWRSLWRADGRHGPQEGFSTPPASLS